MKWIATTCLLACLLACALAAVGCEPKAAEEPGDPSASLVFKREGQEVEKLALASFSDAAVDVDGLDPYYEKEKKFRAVELVTVLERAFGSTGLDLSKQEYILRASDGYTVPMSGELVYSGRPLIAFADREVPDWEPIGPQQANPAPFYLVWSREDQRNLESHPRPWQLAEVEIAPFETVFPKTVPKGLDAGDPAMKGFAIYKEQCVRCHAINQQGGRVGPELNVPRNITEYRPEEQIRAYIKNPMTFRYGNMPAFAHLSDEDLDGIMAYLNVMKGQKSDPAGGGE